MMSCFLVSDTRCHDGITLPALPAAVLPESDQLTERCKG
jgi:hypothetical protein